MRRRRLLTWCARAGATACAALASMLVEGRALASSCTSPDLLETLPADGATNVPTNATLYARYATFAQYLGEAVTLEQTGGATQTVPATYDDTEGMLQIVPPSPLAPGQAYVVHWPQLRGLDTANLGHADDTHFTAGAAADTQAPTFDGVTGIAWDVTRDKDPCTGSVVERYVFDLSLGAADDDGGRDSLALVVFQTTGPQQDPSAPTEVLVERIPDAGQSVRVTRTVDEAVGHVCFAAIVRDLAGRVSTSGPLRCVDTTKPPFFKGCGVGAARGDGASAVWIVAAIAVLASARRGRRA